MPSTQKALALTPSKLSRCVDMPGPCLPLTLRVFSFMLQTLKVQTMYICQTAFMLELIGCMCMSCCHAHVLCFLVTKRHLSIHHGAHHTFVQNQLCASRSCADCHSACFMNNSCVLLQSYITDFSTLLDNSGLNSWIYAVLTASFVVAGFSYQFLPVDTMNAIFGMSAEKGLEDVYLWQLIGGGIATGVAPIAFTQRVCFAMLMLPSASALTYSLCVKSCMVQAKSTVRHIDRSIYRGSYHIRLHFESVRNLH